MQKKKRENNKQFLGYIAVTFKVRILWLFKGQGQGKYFHPMTFTFLFNEIKHIFNAQNVHSFVDIEVWPLNKGQGQQGSQIAPQNVG